MEPHRLRSELKQRKQTKVMCKCKVTDLVHTSLVGSGEINVLQSEKTAAASVAGKMKSCCADCSESIFPGQQQMPVARRTSGITELIRGHAATECLSFHLQPDNHFSKGEIMTNSVSSAQGLQSWRWTRCVQCVCTCMCLNVCAQEGKRRRRVQHITSICQVRPSFVLDAANVCSPRLQNLQHWI